VQPPPELTIWSEAIHGVHAGRNGHSNGKGGSKNG
jgi:hypothetical protein